MTLKYAKNAFAVEAPPGPRWGAHNAPSGPTPFGRQPATPHWFSDKSNTAAPRIPVSITHSLFLFFCYSLMK